MARIDQVSVRGVVTTALPNTRWIVTLPNGQEIPAYLGGKLRKNSIRIEPGDSVQLELSPYSLELARIVYRY